VNPERFLYNLPFLRRTFSARKFDLIVPWIEIQGYNSKIRFKDRIKRGCGMKSDSPLFAFLKATAFYGVRAIPSPLWFATILSSHLFIMVAAACCRRKFAGCSLLNSTAVGNP
jgi:hypothetical protein